MANLQVRWRFIGRNAGFSLLATPLSAIHRDSASFFRKKWSTIQHACERACDLCYLSILIFFFPAMASRSSNMPGNGLRTLWIPSVIPSSDYSQASNDQRPRASGSKRPIGYGRKPWPGVHFGGSLVGCLLNSRIFRTSFRSRCYPVRSVHLTPSLPYCDVDISCEFQYVY